MYTEYFGLREEPFTDTPDPQFFYTSPTCQQAYTALLAGIRERRGLLLLTGEAGTGKTTLLRRLAGDLETSGLDIFFDSTGLTSATFEDLVHFICAELGIAEDEKGRVRQFQAFSAYLAALVRVKEEGTGVLLIDEAQHLTDQVLGSLRLLSPFDMASEKLLLQVVLVGQPELENRLAQPQLRSIKQRIALQCRVERLGEKEVSLYIRHRLQIAGCERDTLFAPEAIARIALRSQGIPRVINLLCDHALMYVYRTAQQTVSAQIVDEMAIPLRLIRSPASLKAMMHTTTRWFQSPPLEKASMMARKTTLSPAVSILSDSGGSLLSFPMSAPPRRSLWASVVAGSLFLLLFLVGLFAYYAPVSVRSPSTPSRLELEMNRASSIMTAAPPTETLEGTAGQVQRPSSAVDDPTQKIDSPTSGLAMDKK